ncbi:TPA: hypothetical protein U1C85_000726 [Streptococcus suis]|nr:hypothetical protein [Streptococcus suis]
MNILTPVNIIFALVFYSMFISDYHRSKPYLMNLLLYLVNGLLALYHIFIYFGLLK